MPPDGRDDRELLELAKCGDVQAFEGLVERHQQRVVNLAYSHLRDYDSALDIAQDVFVQAYKVLVEFDDRAKFTTWLHRVTLNAVISHVRYVKAKKRGGGKPASLDTEFSPEVSDESGLHAATAERPDEELERQELRQAVLEALDSLDEDSRALVLLREFQGLSYEEIASVTGTNLGTVRSRLFRARERLREKLAHLFGN